jgi:hypothetical protein
MPRKSLTRPARAILRTQLNEQREQLFKAHAVANCVRFAISSKSGGLQETDITLALRLTAETIDNVAAALERAGGAS